LANDKKPETLQARELEEAATKGLLVDLGDEQNDALDAISPMSVLTEPTSRTPVRREIDFNENDGGLENDNDGNDSDDDLL
jgi:SpoU rRNA methylase family enzyme